MLLCGCSNTCGEAKAAIKSVPQVITTEGYDYQPPKVTLPVRPKKTTTTRRPTTTTRRPTTTTRRPTTTTRRTTTTTELELLYGVPRQGRNLSKRRRSKKRNQSLV